MSVDETWTRGKRSGLEKWVDDDCGNKDALVCCQPTLFEALQDSGAPNCVIQASHYSITSKKGPKDQENGV